MMGMDQDDIVLAPWTTIKYRVSGTTLTNVNQSPRRPPPASGTSTAVNTLSNLYPGSTAIYLTPIGDATGRYASTHPLRQRGPDLAKAASAEEIPQAIDEITGLLRERHRIHPGDADDFNIRDMTEITKAMSPTSELMATLLLVVALISLVVGGVGIMNIMLVSVTSGRGKSACAWPSAQGRTTSCGNFWSRPSCCACSAAALGYFGTGRFDVSAGHQTLAHRNLPARDHRGGGRFRRRWALFSAFIRPGRRRGWTRSKPALRINVTMSDELQRG